jgi:hypothetical protein
MVTRCELIAWMGGLEGGTGTAAPPGAFGTAEPGKFGSGGKSKKPVSVVLPSPQPTARIIKSRISCCFTKR